MHLIADNYATHKHAAVRAWLAKRPRFVVHFTPTGSSWLTLVERFFADLTGDVIRAGSFASVPHLVRDIKTYLAQRNADPPLQQWKAQSAEILAKIDRARAARNKVRGFDEANSESTTLAHAAQWWAHDVASGCFDARLAAG